MLFNARLPELIVSADSPARSPRLPGLRSTLRWEWKKKRRCRPLRVLHFVPSGTVGAKKKAPQCVEKRKPIKGNHLQQNGSKKTGVKPVPNRFLTGSFQFLSDQNRYLTHAFPLSALRTPLSAIRYHFSFSS